MRVVSGICFLLWLLAASTVAAEDLGVNAHLCGFGPKPENIDLLSVKPTTELITYLDGLRSGKYAFDWSLNGHQAAAQLGFGNRFSAVYSEMAEEARLLLRQHGTVTVRDATGYLSGIVGEEQTIDAMSSRREQHFSAIVYLRALEEGECSFPYVLKDTPDADGVLSDLREAYPALGLERNSTTFSEIYNQTIAAARQRISETGSVSVFRNIEDWRRAILGYVGPVVPIAADPETAVSSGPAQLAAARGIGAQTCLGILNTLNTNPKAQNSVAVASWVQGYLSGRNVQLAFDGRNTRTLEPLLDQTTRTLELCAQRAPQTQFIDVINDYFRTLPELPETAK